MKILIDKATVEQALYALEGLFGRSGGVAVWRLGGSDAPRQAITALRTALGQQAEPVNQVFCFCHDGVSLQIVSGGAAPEGYLGKVTLLIDGEYVDYVKVQPKQQAEPAPIYYMRDNHTFKKLSADVSTALVEIETEFNAGYTYGSLCSKRKGFPMVHAGGSEHRRVFFLECKAVLEKWADVPPAAPPQQQAEPASGCACRWDHKDDRVATCERHQGWLDVIAEWADRARAAEAKLKAAQLEQQAEPVAELQQVGPVEDMMLRRAALRSAKIVFGGRFVTRQAAPTHKGATMTCIGKDPRCPCQDGDACHYKDCGGTKAWPVPKAEPAAYFDFQEQKFSWAKHMQIGPVPVSIKVEPMKLYLAPTPAPMGRADGGRESINILSVSGCA